MPTVTYGSASPLALASAEWGELGPGILAGPVRLETSPEVS